MVVILKPILTPLRRFLPNTSMVLRGIAAVLAVTILVTPRSHAVGFRANAMHEADYGLQLDLPPTFGAGEFTLEVRVRLDDSYPVGPVLPQNSPGQLVNWAGDDPAPYSSGDWWFAGNFLLDGHNNNVFWEGTCSIQICGGGRVRWLLGDDVNVGLGGPWAVQAHPSSTTPSLLDGQWHWIGLVRRWAPDGGGADLELWVDGKQIAQERSNSRADLTRYWNGFAEFREGEEGWFWGSEKQAAAGSLEQYEDFKGELAELRFWAIARAPEDLAAPMREAAAGAPGLVGLYRFPEQFGGRVCNELSGGECIEFLVADRRWKPGGFQDWTLFAAYFSVALLTLRRARAQGWRQAAGAAWAVSAVSLATLAIVTPLDLELLAEQLLRRMARAQGWYEVRQGPQVLGLLLAGTAAFALYRAMTRRAAAVEAGARAALGICGALVMIALARISSWDLADSFLGFGPAQFSFGWLLEFLGAFGVGVAAIISGHSRGEPAPE